MLDHVRAVNADDFGPLLEILDLSSSREPWIGSMHDEWDFFWSQSAPMGFTAEEGGRPVSMLMAVFTQSSFAEYVKASPRPYVNGQLVERHASGLHELAPDPDKSPSEFEDFCRDGLHLHFVHVVFRELDPYQMAPSRTRIAQAFLQTFAGAPIDSLSVEAHGLPSRESGLSIGLKLWNDFSASKGSGEFENEPTLLGASQEDALRSGNHWLETMLCPSRARLKLSLKQRRILFHARNGLGDREIAARCYLSPASMKTYWDRIYGIFEQCIPGVFASGASKRSAVLEYVRFHPEECWCPRDPQP